MEKKKILIELPIDLYARVMRLAEVEERSIRSMINILIKDGLKRRK